ncbi:MAG: transposase [Gammaproteobacteria bacterium]|nr:transposase [Gammaproteobacteria bacterium]
MQCTGKAIRYTDNLWDKLTLYINDGQIPIDNNPAENAIRPPKPIRSSHAIISNNYLNACRKLERKWT